MHLQKGDTILLLAPAFAVAPEVAQHAVAYWQAQGMQPRLMPHALGKHHAYSGTDAERLADLLTALQDPTAKAIQCLRGGYGFTRILDQLPLQELLTAYPKYLLGFSDITAGLLAWQAVGFGHLAIHAPMASHLAGPTSTEALALASYLSTQTYHQTWADATAVTHAGITLTASVTGGNLTLLAHALGSTYPLKAQGHFLLIEEVGEQLYHIDRMLLQLRRGGALEGLAGVLLGHFTDVKDIPQGFGRTVQEIVQEHVGPATVVAAGFPAGHALPNAPVPFGVPLTLSAEGGKWHLFTENNEI